MNIIAETKERLREVWEQRKIPVIFRQKKGKPLLIKLPYANDNKIFIQDSRRNKPNWNHQYKCWETPKAWFNDLVSKILKRHSKLYIIQPYQEQEKCAPSCWNAAGHICQCSCMGANHGSQSSTNNWFIVSDAFATRWGEQELACRLMMENELMDRNE